MLLDGLHIPLTTPFYPDGRVYLRKLESNVGRYSLTLASGLIALSAAGEAALLSDAERHKVLEIVAQTAGKEKVLIAVLSQPSVAQTLAFAEIAAGLLYDAVLVEAPSAYPERMWNQGQPTPELLTYFGAVADGSPLPVLLCSHSAHGVLPVEAIARLAGHPNVLGLLEQSRHVSRVVEVLALTASYRRTLTVTPTFTAVTTRMLQDAGKGAGAAANFVSAEVLGGGSALATVPPVPAIKTRSRDVGFQVLWAHCEDVIEALRAGATGMAPDLAAAVPQACFEVWAAWKDGDVSLMAEKARRVQRAELAVQPLGVAGLKAACEGSGYFGGRPRLPLLAPSAGDTQLIRSAFDGMRS